jgi:hypothetical protein
MPLDALSGCHTTDEPTLIQFDLNPSQYLGTIRTTERSARLHLHRMIVVMVRAAVIDQILRIDSSTLLDQSRQAVVQSAVDRCQPTFPICLCKDSWSPGETS